MQATVRTFRAADPRSALNAVKAALGPDAIIIATREIRSSLFHKAEVEVTAAASDAPVPLRPLPNRSPAPRAVAAAYTQHAPSTPHIQASVPPMRDHAAGNAQSNGRVLPPHMLQLQTQLEDMGVPPAQARVWVEQCRVQGGFPGPGSAMELVRGMMMAQLQCAPAPWLDARRSVLGLVGPTGVGKTTTLVKMAARAIMEAHLKVAFVTVDTYRIGASDQLARYGQILNVPTHLARNVHELNTAVAACRDCHLVLVDTAGRFEQHAVAAQVEMLRSVPDISLFMTFSAAAGAREVHATSQRFQGASPDGYVVTKLDEAVAPGSMFAVDFSVRRPLMAFTNGQSIPEDIHAADAAALVSIIAG